MPEVAGGAGGSEDSVEGGTPTEVDWSEGGAGVSSGGPEVVEAVDSVDSVAGGAGVDSVAPVGGAVSVSGVDGTGTSAVPVVAGGAPGVAGGITGVVPG